MEVRRMDYIQWNNVFCGKYLIIWLYSIIQKDCKDDLNLFKYEDSNVK